MSGLPDSGAPLPDGTAEALMISPTPQAALGLASATGSNDTENLVWLLVMAMMAIPGLIVMTLIATVLIRR